MTAVGIILFWGELAQNFLGLPLEWSRVVTAICLLADFSLYSLTLCLTYHVLLPKQQVDSNSAVSRKRRQFLARAGVAARDASARGEGDAVSVAADGRVERNV